MRFTDVTLLAKKILVGAFLTVVPLLILIGGLRFTERMLTGKPTRTFSSQTR